MNRHINKDDGADSDHLFLDRVLNNLYDFGDGKASKRNKKLKKRKKCEDDFERAVVKDNGCGRKDPFVECLTVKDQQKSSEDLVVESSMEREVTSASIQTFPVQVITFEDPSKKLRTKKDPIPNVKLPPAKDSGEEMSEQFSLEKARLEVHRFGITGYHKEQQRMFEQERAIMLGARPPKKEYVNYKEYQRMIKDKKLQAKEEVTLDLKKKKKKPSKPRDGKRKSSSSSGAPPPGHVGRFKNGMLVLSAKDIQKVKASKARK